MTANEFIIIASQSCYSVSDNNDMLESTHELEDDEIDLRCYKPSGGVILLDLYTLPPQSKTMHEWTVTQGMHNISSEINQMINNI